MTALKLIPLALFVVVGAETPACQADDVALLQEKLKTKDIGQGHVTFPDLGALKDALGNIVDQVTDFASKGIDQVTSKLGDALEAADNEVLVLQAKCNDSMEMFYSGSSMNATMLQNVTRLKKLANETVGAMIPLYHTISQQVTQGFTAAQALLKPIGLHDEAEKLGACARSAGDYLSHLTEKGTATLADLQEATAENVGPTLAKLRTNLGDVKSTAGNFMTEFDSTFKGFSDSFVQAILEKLPADKKDTLGVKIQNSGETLTDKVHDLCEDVKKLVDGVSEDMEAGARSVDPMLAEISSPGFFGRIGNFFKHLFR